MEFEREQEEAAAQEAAPHRRRRVYWRDEFGDPLDYIERDSRPAGASADEAWRPVEETGGGEAEGFEEAEAVSLIERAENAPRGRHRSPTPARWDEEAAALDPEYGEADELSTAEDEPDDTGDR